VGYVYIANLKCGKEEAKPGEYVPVTVTLHNTDSNPLTTRLVVYANGHKFYDKQITMPGYKRDSISWLLYMPNADLKVDAKLLSNCEMRCSKSCVVKKIGDVTNIECVKVTPDKTEVKPNELITLTMTFKSEGGDVASTEQFGIFINDRLVDNTVFVTMNPDETKTVQRNIKIGDAGNYLACVKRLSKAGGNVPCTWITVRDKEEKTGEGKEVTGTPVLAGIVGAAFVAAGLVALGRW